MSDFGDHCQRLRLQYVKNPSNYLEYQLSWQVLLNLNMTVRKLHIKYTVIYGTALNIHHTKCTTRVLNLKLTYT